MAFCSSCGTKVNDEAKFCEACGTSIKTNMASNETKRHQEYAGKIIKCPNCGEGLEVLAIRCPSCGYEVRRAEATNSVKKLSNQLVKASSMAQKEMIIRSFPIPNSKEDILEFVILASSNIDRNTESELSDAWIAKFEQAYQKAQMMFHEDALFDRVEQIHADTCKKIVKLNQRKNFRKISNTMSEMMPIIPHLIVITCWLMSIFILLPLSGKNLDVAGTNAFQLLLMLDIIAGTFIIPLLAKNEIGLPRLIITLGLMMSIILLIPLCGKNLDVAGKNAYQIILMVDIVCSVIIFVKIFKNRPKTNAKLGGSSFVISGFIMILFIVSFGITSLFVSLTGSGKSDNEKFDWPEDGFATVIPSPDSDEGNIWLETEHSFCVDVYISSKKEYNTYVQRCIDEGFDVDASKASDSYDAYNAEGYKLSIKYSDYKDPIEMGINLDSPVNNATFSWPSIGMATSIPKPKSNIGVIHIDTHIQLNVSVADTPVDTYNEYVQQCIDEGFNVDYSKGDTYYSADNKKGDSLSIEFEGNNTMKISLYSVQAFKN